MYSNINIRNINSFLITQYLKRVIYNKKLLILIIFALSSLYTYSQSTIGIKFSPIGIHPFKETNKKIFDNKIDAEGLLVIEPAIFLAYERYFREDELSFLTSFILLNDAAAKPSFSLHLGVKYRFFQVWKNSLSLSLGGNLYGRETWNTIPGYVPRGSWKQNGSSEFGFGIMSELEYSYYITENNDITFSLIYGHQPNTFTLTIGYRYWISSIIKNPKKCGSCPFSKKSNKWNY